MELSNEIIAQLQERASNSAARSDAADLNASSVSDEELLGRGRAEVAAQPEDVQQGVREYLEGMNSPFAGMIVNNVFGDGRQAKGLMGMLGGLLGGKQMFASIGGETVAMGGRRKPTKAPPPAGEAKVEALEAKIGFTLPAGLRQVYVEVADGGVGPGDGLYSLKQLVAKWREMTDEPVGPRGQKWPAHLLPVTGDRWDLTCIDMKSGRMVVFDVEEVDYGGWKKCFQDDAESLEAWLAEWLKKPTAEERAAIRAERPEPRYLTDEDYRAYEEDHPEYAEWQRRAAAFTMTPEDRVAIGLPEKGWEAKVFEGLDASKIGHPTPGYAQRRRPKE